jgi:hypothetical protein
MEKSDGAWTLAIGRQFLSRQIDSSNLVVIAGIINIRERDLFRDRLLFAYNQ